MPQYFNSTSATPWKTARQEYRGGGVVRDGKGMGVALRSQMGIKKGKKIPASKLKAAAKKGGKLGKRANLALTFRKMRKG